jgi:hypothetical protein
MKDVCCECKHFRMFKPIESYCTIKKQQVSPIGEPVCEKYDIRKGLRVV